MSITCKDGVDKSSTALLELYMLLKIANGETLSDTDYKQVWRILYLPSLITRERLVLPEHFHRALNTIRKLESAQKDYGIKGFTKVINEGWQIHGEAGVVGSLIVD